MIHQGSGLAVWSALLSWVLSQSPVHAVSARAASTR